MSGRSRRPGFVCICLIVLLAGARPALLADDELIVFYSLYQTGSGWQTDGSGKYLVYQIGLNTGDMDFTRWNADADPNCGIAAHKAGDAGWPGHYHVHRSNDETSPWCTSYGGYASACKPDAKKYWEVMFLDNGSDPKASVFARDDEQDVDCHHGDPNFKTNCYGYALDKTGVEDYNNCVLDDGDIAVKRGLDAYYEQIPGPSHSRDTLMYMHDHHANWVRIANEDCKIECLKFKWRASQIFEFDYDPPGRSKSRDFLNLWDVTYYVEE
jgi:hypothetical protein